MTKPVGFYTHHASEIDSHNVQLGLGDAGELYSSQDWRTFHNLVTHDGEAGKEAPELMMQTLVAVFLLRALKFKKYFEDGGGEERSVRG